MELYTRVIEEGIFVFWDEQDSNRYELSIFIYNNDKKIRLVNTKIEQGINCYSLTHIGSGSYEIELNVYHDSRLIETVTKKATLTSTNQRTAELSDKLNAIFDKLNDIEYSVDHIDLSAMDTLANALTSPNKEIDRENWAKFLLNLEIVKNEIRKEWYD